MSWLKKLSALASTNHQRLIIVIPSYQSDYKQSLSPAPVLFDKLLKLDLPGTEIVNFYQSGLFVDADFGDATHMNETGAIKMTAALKNIMNFTDTSTGTRQIAISDQG